MVWGECRVVGGEEGMGTNIGMQNENRLFKEVEEKLFSFKMQSILIFLKSLCLRFCFDYNLLIFCLLPPPTSIAV